MSEEARNALVICAPTFFNSRSESRFVASMATLSLCREKGYSVLLVDGSPRQSGVRELMSQAGALVLQETGQGKANALRQALSATKEHFPTKKIIAFQELEKTDFIRFYELCVAGFTGEFGAPWDMCNPARSEDSWNTYPVEQALEEKFQNRLMNLNAANHGFTTALDWSFGPFLLKSEFLNFWTKYEGQSYDAQWGPMIVCFRSYGSFVIGTPAVDYQHPAPMKKEEEGDWNHAINRLRQLNGCVTAHQRVWEEADRFRNEL